MAQCWKCGGQMPPYAVRCGWCGRSTTVSAFVQVISIAVVIVGALVVAGVVPMSRITRYIPGLRTEAGPAVVAADVSPLPDQSPPADVSPSAPGSPASSRPLRRAAEPPSNRGGDHTKSDNGTVAGPATQALTARVACDAEDRVDALAAQHPGWGRAELILIACRKVGVGFTGDQVIASIGRPRRVNRPDGASQVEEWVYRTQRVVLERGQVVSVRPS